MDWQLSVSKAKEANASVDCVDLAATNQLYILYTSGTTGEPKGVVRDTGGHMVALKWSMGNIYNTHPREVYWAASDVDWVVGHSYIVYGPLLQGCTTILFEGKPVGTPDAGTFWRVIEEHKASTLFTAPTALRAIKKEDANGLHLKNMTPPRSRHCSSRGNARTLIQLNGQKKNLACPSLIIGGKQKQVGPSRPIRWD